MTMRHRLTQAIARTRVGASLAQLRHRQITEHARTAGFAEVGARSVVRRPFTVSQAQRITIGSDVHVGRRAWFSVLPSEGTAPMVVIGDGTQLGNDFQIACAERIEIGRSVLAADRVFICDTYHEYRDASRPAIEQGYSEPRPVRIGDGAFLGINVVVLPGVTIGERAYVGAGAVVTEDVPAQCVAVGNPARVVRRWDGQSWRAEPSG